ncbi:MAG: hypothetical protein KJ069_21460 [Anaerolineae bacterium]|nr:hypothetical protein [Anaerolineae bacterium]
MKKKKNNGYNTLAPIEPWQVDAFLDGIYDEQVEKYIIEHGEAALQMAAIKDFDERMTALLYRVSCPETDALLNYQWGLLDEEESALIATHIAECAECQTEALALAVPAATTEKPSVTAVIKGKLPALSESLRTFIGRLIPEEQVLVPAIRSAGEPADLVDVDTNLSLYVNFFFPDMEADPHGFSSNHIYAIAKATKKTAVDTAPNLYVIKPEAFAPQPAPPFADFDWAKQESAIFYIKKVKPGLADPADRHHLYHIDVVEKAVLSTDDTDSYYTIIPVDSLMLGHSQPDDEYNAYRIMKLTADKPAVPTLPKDEKFALFPAVGIIPFKNEVIPRAPNKSTSKQKLFTVEELGLDIILTQRHTLDGDYGLEGQVLGGTAEAVCKVSLIHDKAVVKTVELTPSGTFSFDKLDQAQYWLCFYGHGVEVCLAVI